MTARSMRTRRIIVTSLFIMLAGFVGIFAATSFPLAAFQSQQAPTLRIVSEDGNRLPVVIITGDDIRNLPSGENRIIQKFAGGDSGAASTRPSGKVTFHIDNLSRNTSINLTKTGAGTLIFPSASNNSGVTKAGQGILRNSADNSSSLTKELTGTLILAATGNAVAGEQLTLNGPGTAIVYEFRNMGPAELARIFMPGETTSVMARITGLRKATVQHSPKRAQSWPIARVLIIPAKGIARVEGWKSGVISNATPASKFECRDSFCFCDGGVDCNNMIKSGACSSDVTFEESGSGLTGACSKS